MTTGSATILPPLFACLETLSLIARHLDPSTFAEMMAAVGTPDERLRAARAEFNSGDALDGVGDRIAAASDEALAAFT